jgi:hypothetical protein
MSEVEFPIAPANQRVIYRSFLLRLRQVKEEGASNQQFFIKDIQTKEEFYFANIADMTSFLNDFLSGPGENL